MFKCDVISDVHNCYYELTQLFIKLGYEEKNGIYIHPERRVPVFVGDIIDKGPAPLLTYNLVKRMVMGGWAKMVRGNHEDKLGRWAQGKDVKLNNGLDKTVAEFQLNEVSKKSIVEFVFFLPYFMILDEGKLVITHGAWKEEYKDEDPYGKRVRTWSLFMPNKGVGEDGFPIRLNWVGDRKLNENSPIIIYGHQPYREVRIENKTYGIDTGCVFGNKLTSVRYPEMEIVSVDANAVYCSKNIKWSL